jgi:hypothetical protein
MATVKPAAIGILLIFMKKHLSIVNDKPRNRAMLLSATEAACQCSLKTWSRTIPANWLATIDCCFALILSKRWFLTSSSYLAPANRPVL